MKYLSISEFEKAAEGSIFIKKNGQLVGVNKKEFLKELKPIKQSINKIEESQAAINKMNKFFDLYSKPHFQVVFNAFMINVILGTIEVEDDSTLKLDELVCKDMITVQAALEKHTFLKEKFNELFINNKKELKGFWEV